MKSGSLAGQFSIIPNGFHFDPAFMVPFIQGMTLYYFQESGQLRDWHVSGRPGFYSQQVQGFSPRHRVYEPPSLLPSDYLRFKLPKREAGHSLPANAEVNSAWSFSVATPPNALAA